MERRKYENCLGSPGWRLGTSKQLACDSSTKISSCTRVTCSSLGVQNKFAFGRLEVLTALDMKSNILCNETPCSQVEEYRCFGRAYCLHLHGWRVNWANKQIVRCLLYQLTPAPWTRSSAFLRDVGKLLSNYTALYFKQIFSKKVKENTFTNCSTVERT
jgi:hypothetical protein